MIAEAGLAALWLAAALALLQLVLAFAPAPDGGGTAPVRSIAIVEGAKVTGEVKMDVAAPSDTHK